MATIINAFESDSPVEVNSPIERRATFSKVGKVVTPDTRFVSGIPEEMAFTVRKEQNGFLLPDGTFKPIEGECTVVRNSDNHPFGTVSSHYSPIDNVTALGCLQYIEGLEIKRYGSTRNGMQYIIGSLPDTEILGDTFTPYLIFRNSFNGLFPIQAAISPLRIVCQNQLTMAFKEASNTFRIRHSVNASERLADAQRILLGTSDFMTELNKVAEQYASKKITRAQEFEIIRDMFPITDDMPERKQNNIKERIARFQTALSEDDNSNFRGTAWGLINAYSDYISHYNTLKNTKTADENNFVSVTFDSRIIQLMMNAINRVVA